MIDVSRIVAGARRLEVAAVDLAAVVRAAVDAARPAAEAKGLRLEDDAVGAVGEVTGDADWLQPVVANLVGNAVKFTPRGGSVAVELRRDGALVTLRVRDDGEGIPADFLPRLFQRFRQADGRATRRSGGLGLGLAIARHLVELHGGTIHAASDGPGRGATFTVVLPAAASQPTRDA